MSTRKLLTALCLTILAAASAEAAGRPRGAEAPPPQLYSLDKAVPPQAGRLFLPDAAEEFLIQVDPAIVAADPRVLLIDLPGQPLLEAVRTRFDVYGPDWKSWFGTLRPVGDSGEGTGSIYLGYHGDRLTADLSFGGERYEIVGGPETGQRLARLSNELSPPSCGLDTSPDSLGAELLDEDPDADRSHTGAKAVSIEKAATRIDVLALYPKEFFRRGTPEETELFCFVKDSIAKANVAFSNSRIEASYHLVGTVPLVESSQPTNGLYNSLGWLSAEYTPTEVAALRNAFGADVVVLFIPQDWKSNNYCGVANQPLQNGNFVIANTVPYYPMGDRAFSVVRSGCGRADFTVAHEIGHNYGLRHSDWEQNPSVDLYPQARGYVFQVGADWKATILGCTCGKAPLPACGPDIVTGVCNRIGHFSNPDVSYMGVPTGTRPTVGDAGRDEASVIRAQMSTYAAFRPSSSNTPPNASFTVSCAGRTCTFNAGGSTDNLAIPSGNYWWDFGDGSNIKQGTKNISHTYTAAGSKRVHLVVKDSGGQTDVVWGTASPTSVLEGYHDVSNCRMIHGWAWDGTPAAAIDVDVYRDGTKVATVPANLFRQDLLTAGKGNGYHAFHYGPNPNHSWFDGQWHTATVKYAGTATNLPGTGQQIICDARIFTTQAPAENLATGGQVYTVATQLSSNRSGYITQLGFYRAAGETGTNTLRLYYDSGGPPLAEAPTSCSSSGWCWGSISPVAITAGTRYRVTVNTNTYQAKTGCGIGSGITNNPLTAHAGFWIAGDVFPTNGSCSNFFVDVKYQM